MNDEQRQLEERQIEEREYNDEMAYDELLAKVERLRDEARWIPVTPDTPERNKGVLVGWLGSDKITVAIRTGNMWSDLRDESYYLEAPTHWKPYPETPDEWLSRVGQEMEVQP